MLDILAKHPRNTARFISKKLAQHFVADEPPPALIDRMAKTFQDTNGDIRRLHNDQVPGKTDRPSIEMPELGVHCQAIMELRHVDVYRDGRGLVTPASTTCAKSSRTRATVPVSCAQQKSTSSTKCTCCRRLAFNGLLKTLEEPPEHVKFLFATTEIEKVPVTVRSRCIRFDLQRIESSA